MQSGRDPVERAADDDQDLYGVATWEPRSVLDRAVSWAYAALRPLARWLLVGLAVVLLVGSLAGGLTSAVTDSTVRFFVALSVAPALLLAAYVRYADVTSREPLGLLGVTFVLGVLFASFAVVINEAGSAAFVASGLPLAEGETALSGLGGAAFFYLVVGPAEETVKLLAVALYPYRDARFDTVVDGAVYGAVAGLGFATVENALYITSQAGAGVGFPELAGLAAVRALAGPGHVIYSGIAGYYLGLAKFNRANAGPLVAKGLLIAAALHGTYNTLVGIVPGAAAGAVAGRSVAGAFVGFVLVFDGLAGLYLFRKVYRYGRVYRAVGAGGDRNPDPELTEFDPDAGRGDPGVGPTTTGSTGDGPTGTGSTEDGHEGGVAWRSVPDPVGDGSGGDSDDAGSGGESDDVGSGGGSDGVGSEHDRVEDGSASDGGGDPGGERSATGDGADRDGAGSRSGGPGGDP